MCAMHILEPPEPSTGAACFYPPPTAILKEQNQQGGGLIYTKYKNSHM